MKIRAITIFANLSLPLVQDQLSQLGDFASSARQAYEGQGLEVQTTRLATNILSQLSRWPGAPDLVNFAQTLERMCHQSGFEYVSLGIAEEDNLAHLPAVFAATQSVFATANLIHAQTGAIDGHCARAAARVMQKAACIENGFGNLRFAALANVPAGTPFFPAAYCEEGKEGSIPSFAIATESADLAVAACQNVTSGTQSSATDVHTRLREAIEMEAARIVAVAQSLSQMHGLRFGGIDFSLAPFPDTAISIGRALECLSGQPLGAAGTLASAATLTSAIDQASFPHTGFCGLMMPVLEDPVLAQRAAEGRLRLGELLQWSAVCGTGLDTVPLPGNASISALTRVLFDVAALSARLHKPLTARLMPLPGKVAGDPVHFDFPYFADGGVLPLDCDNSVGTLTSTTTLKLTARNAQGK